LNESKNERNKAVQWDRGARELGERRNRFLPSSLAAGRDREGGPKEASEGGRVSSISGGI